MGSDDGQECERPVHRVWVDDFYLGATQVTNAEYACYLMATGKDCPRFWHDENFNHPQQPVAGVSWFEAEQYCAWLAEESGRAYRLPNEAEWERAARGDREQGTYPWGDAAAESLPNYSERWLDGPEAVKLYSPNDFGLYNMCDNVHEWCSDWFDANYYVASPARNPKGPETGQRKSSRGGAWRHQVKVSRCSARSSIPPGLQYADYGFRLACEIRKDA